MAGKGKFLLEYSKPLLYLMNYQPRQSHLKLILSSNIF